MTTVFSSPPLQQPGEPAILTDPGEGRGARGSAAPALPCLSSNNSDNDEGGKVNRLTGGHRRTAFTLANEIQDLAKVYGLERLGFLTLTFADQVTNIREAQRRFNNLNRRVLKSRYKQAIGVVERQQSRRLHFHLVVVLAADIRTGFDFAGIERRDYRSANQAIRQEWAFWRNTAPRYGFGRTELLPIKSTAEGIARYVGKYVSKHIHARDQADKGARIVRFIGYSKKVVQSGKEVTVSTRSYSSRFGWNTSNGWLWRRKLAAWAKAHDVATLDELRELFGPRWAYRFQDEILATLMDECAPNKTTAERSHALSSNDWMRSYLAEKEKAVRNISPSRSYIIRARPQGNSVANLQSHAQYLGRSGPGGQKHHTPGELCDERVNLRKNAVTWCIREGRPLKAKQPLTSAKGLTYNTKITDA